MFNVLHLADLHLGWVPPFLDAPRARERQRRRDDVLRRAIDYCMAPQSKVRLVLVAGDLFDSHHPSAELVSHVLGQLRRLGTQGIRLVTVPGHYDELSYAEGVYRQYASQWPDVLVSWPERARALSIEVGGTPVHVDSFAYVGGVTALGVTRVEPAPPEREGVNILMVHGAVVQDGADAAASCVLGLDAASLASSGYDYVALGGGHTRAQWNLGRTLAVQPGLVEGRGFEEPGGGCLTVARWSSYGFEVNLEPVVVQPVATATLDVGALEGPEELERMLAAQASTDTLLRLRLTGSRKFPIDTRQLKAKQEGRFFHFELLDETLMYTEAELERHASESTVLGELVRRMQRLRAQAPDPASRRIVELALNRGIQALRGVAEE